MQCPECGDSFEILDSRLYNFTDCSLGCRVTGRWPKHTARVLLDNVELLQCACGVCVNVPHLNRVQQLLFNDGSDPKNINIDPYSDYIYVGTWDDDEQVWILSQHLEQ